MQRIGTIDDDAQARHFSDFLYGVGIENEVEADAEGAWEVWVHDVDALGTARGYLGAFLTDPGAPEFAAAAKAAAAREVEEERDRAAYTNRMRRSERMLAWGWLTLAPIANVLIFVSVLLTAFSVFGTRDEITRPLLIANYEVKGEYIHYDKHLSQVGSGQIWRLVTPIFLHFNLLHLFFNMWWMRDLGIAVERTTGTRVFGLLILVLAVLSNVGQFFAGGPRFGGMSGVVFGLLGYAWIRGKYDLTSGLFVAPQTVWIMSAWFLICFTGFVGPIANTAHGVGLVVGLAWGYLTVPVDAAQAESFLTAAPVPLAGTATSAGVRDCS